MFLACAGATLLCDQITKAIVRAHMGLRVAIPLLGDFLRLRYVQNAGAAFGFYQGGRILLMGVSILSACVVIYLVRSGRYRFRGSNVAFGLVLGGALGNLVDRFALREVVDFIDMGIGPHRWPTYNVADIGITLGVVYVAVAFLMGEWHRPGTAPGADASAPIPGPEAERGDG
jgi:signal peptidase II